MALLAVLKYNLKANHNTQVPHSQQCGGCAKIQFESESQPVLVLH